MAIDFEKIRKAAAAKDQAAQAAGLEAKTAYKPADIDFEEIRLKARERAKASDEATKATVVGTTIRNAEAQDDGNTPLKQNHSGAASANTDGGVVGNALKGAAKSTASGWVNTGGTLLDLMSNASKRASEENRKANQQAENAAHYREMLERGTLDNGKAIDDQMRAWLQEQIASSEKRAKVYAEANENIHSHGAEAVQGLYKTADKLAAESGQHITAAKKNTGAVGDFLVDVGVAGTQLVGDALTGGLVATGIRTFGSGAQEARQSGATLGQQVGYGAGSAAVGVVAEKLANVAGPFKKAFGSGVLDKALAKVAAKPAGMLAISALSEGAEEGVEALVQPLLQKLTYNPDAAYDADWVADTLYSMVIGGVLGGAGGGIDVAMSGRGQNLAPRRSAGAQIAQNEGKVTPAQEAGAQGLSGDIMTAEARRLFGQNKTAPKAGADSTAYMEKGTKKGNSPQSSAEHAADLNGQPLQRTPEAPLELLGNPKSRVAQKGGSVNVENMDPLLKLMMGGKVGGDEAGIPINSAEGRRAYPNINKVLEGAAANTGAGENKVKDFDPLQEAARNFGKPKQNRDPLLEILLGNKESTLDEDGIPIDSQEGYRMFPGINRALKQEKRNVFREDGANGAPEASEAGAVYQYGPGAADAGYSVQGTDGAEKTSRMADSTPYNRQQEAATGMTKDEYDRLFRYESQTERRSMRLAEELLYMVKDGKRTFLKDIDEDSYAELIRSLDEATAWNGPQTDAAHMIQTELQGRSINVEIESEEYVNWLRIMREHETSTGQGVQANAKWSRTDNHGGSATEMEAWENLEQSNLSGEERVEAFRRIVQWDMEIEAATDTSGLKDIVLQVAEQRGVIDGPFGVAFRKVADKALDSLTFEQLKQFAYASTSALSTDHTPANWGKKLKTIQVLNMLSSPKTATKNIVGNTSFYGIDALAMDGAAVLDMALSHVTGTRSVAMERAALGKNSAKDAAKAMQMAIAEITLDVDMNSSESRYGTGSRRTFKANGNLLERTLSAIERNQAYLLTATDEFYKGAARGTAQNTQKLVESGKIKTADKDYAAKQAEQLAKYRTFQDDGKISVMIQQIHDVLNLVGVGDSGKAIRGHAVHAFGAGDIVAPFTRVAGNLVSRGLEYSPVNTAKGVLEISQQVAKAVSGQVVDPATQAKGVSDLARGMTGTAIAYGFMLLTKEGLLRQADDEEDPDVAAMNQSEGIAGTQINVSAVERALTGGGTEWQTGDTLVDLSSIEPLNFLVNLGVELAKEDSNPIVSTFGATVNSAMSAATELPILESAGDFAEDVFKYGADPKESLAQEAANTLISSVVPNVVAGVAKGLDDRPRNTYAGDDLWSIIQASFKNRIPGLRETLPGSVNSMGEEKLYHGSEDALLAALLSPVKINTYSQSDISKEMARVREATGDSGFYPSKSIPKELSYTDKSGKKHIASLDYEQRQDFQRDRNTLAIITGTNVMASVAYKNATATKQAELLNDANSYAYEVAKANIMGKDSVSAWVGKTMDATRATGLNPATVIVYRDKLSAEKQKEQTTAQANKVVRNAIMADSGLTTAQKNALDNIVISDGVYIPKDVEVDYSNVEAFTISQMSEGAQKRWSGIKNQFGMDADTYNQAWNIYQNDDLTADQKRKKLSALGYNGTTLYKAFGKKLS